MNFKVVKMLMINMVILCRALLMTCLISVTILSAAEAGEVKILSYNILANWSQERGDKIIAVIKDQNPDIAGLQEGVGDNIGYLVDNLAEEYDAHFIGTEVPILIRKTESLRLIDSGSTEIFRCALDRYVNWVRLEDTTSGKQFIYYNTHLCAMFANTLEGISNEDANQKQAGQIMDVMLSHVEDGVVQIIGGDLNTFASSKTTRFFLEQRPLPYNGQENPLSLKESWAAAPNNTGDRPLTMGGGAVPERRSGGSGRGGAGRGRGGGPPQIEIPDEPGIDWLFVSEYADVIASEVIKDNLTTGTSDHFPISATFKF